MRPRILLVTAAIAVAAALSTACGPESDSVDARSELDEAEARVDARTRALLPVLADELGADYGAGSAAFESCTMGVTGDARYVATAQFRESTRPAGEAGPAIASALAADGWTLAEETTGGHVGAERDGLTLSLTIDTFATDVRIESACVRTSDDLARDYTGRDDKEIPAP